MKNVKNMLAFCLSIIMLLNTVLPAYASEVTKNVGIVWVIQSIEPVSGTQRTVPYGTAKEKLDMPQKLSVMVYNQADEKKAVEKRELSAIWGERAEKPYQPQKAETYRFLAKIPGEYIVGEGVTVPEILVTVSPEAPVKQTESKGSDSVNIANADETDAIDTNAIDTNEAETEIQSDSELEEKNSESITENVKTDDSEKNSEIQTEIETEGQTKNSEAVTETEKSKLPNKDAQLKGSGSPADMSENMDVKRDLVLKYKIKDQEGIIDLKNNAEISDLTKVEYLEARYHFAISDNTIDGKPNRTMKAGDYYFVELPQEARIKDEFQAGGEMKRVDGTPVAMWEVINQDGKFLIKVTFAEIVDDMGEFDINGNFTFQFGLEGKELRPDTIKVIKFPIDGGNSLDITVKTPPLPETTLAKLEKKQQDYDEKTRELTYKVIMSTKSDAPGVWGGWVITDTLDIKYLNLISIKHGDTELVMGTDYTYDEATGQIEYTIPAGRDGNSFKEITIVTKVLADAYANSGTINIENTASALEPKSGVTIPSNTVTTPIPTNWISKKGSPIEGNRIQWEITINENHQNLYNAVMTDTLGAELTLDSKTFKVDGASLTPGIPDDNGSYYEVNGQDIAYYFGQRGPDNKTHVVTFITDVEPLAVGDTSEKKEYNNTAKLTADYEGDDGSAIALNPQIGTIGVGIPTVYITKSPQSMTAKDKKDGTLFWEIQASSNLETYGQSTIVDTIPTDMRDKYSFIDGEIYIGGMNDSNKISSRTDIKTELLDTNDDTKYDKITITFLGDNALAKIQKVYIKTKLSEEFYGKNILKASDGKVTNDVTATLYKTDVSSKAEASDKYTGNGNVSNKVIQKWTSAYNGNNSGQGQNLRMNYSIKLNENQMPLKNAVVTDELKNIETWVDATNDNKTNYVKQTGLKAHWKYVPGSLVIARSAGSADSLDLNAITGSVGYADDILTINMGDFEDCYTITFTAELDVTQDEILQKNGNVQGRGNIANITAGGLNGTIATPPVTSSPTMKNEVLKKTGKYDKDTQQATWTIRMNQHQFSLKNTTMIDHFMKGLTLDPTSVKLYKNVIDSKGDFLADNKLNDSLLEDKSQYTYTTKTETDGSQIFTFNMEQDNTAYILQFATDVDKSLLGNPINNEAYYAGNEGGAQEHDTAKVDVGSAAGGSSTRKGMITIQKKDAETAADLTGAIFELKWLPTGEEPVVIRQLATDKGKVTFYGLALGETYSLTETKAPNGYGIDDKTPKVFTVNLRGGEQSIAGMADNTFTNSPIKSGTAVINATKKLTGHAQTAGQFSFEMFDETNTKVADGTTGAPLASGDSKISFTPVDPDNNPFVIKDNHIFSADEPKGTTFEASRKTYKIKESGTAPAGYTYDTKEYEVIIVATNEKGKKDLKMEVLEGGTAVTPEKPLEFTNVYNAVGDISLTAEKLLNGHSLTEDNKFTFELYKEGEDVPLKSVENGTDGLVTFTDLNYTQDDIGENVYIIKERIPAENPKDGYTYDTQEFKVKVVVTDNHDGTLKTELTDINGAVPSDTNKIIFTNTYKTADAKLQLNSKKILNGRTLGDAQFSFMLEELDTDGSPITGKTQEKKNSADGAVAFDEFRYTQADIGKTFTYRITENAGDAPGYTYDSTQYLIAATVKDNNDGTMQVELAGSKTKGGVTTAVANPKTDIVFENSYEATGELNLTANKTLTGRTLAENQFSFSVKEVKKVKTDDAELANGSNASDGTISFSSINYTLNKDINPLGEHTYTVSELKGSASGYTYDEKEYTVKVMVSDNGDGTLKSEITSMKLADKDADALKFDNTYKASGTLTIQGTKFLNGRALADKQFDFELKNEAGDVLETVSNGQAGEFKFTELKYTEQDAGKTYRYTVSEKNKAALGYTYDDSVYTLTVNVTDDGKSHMTAEAVLTKDGASVEGNAITFTNTYKANGSFTPTAKKTLSGRILEGEQFTFTLRDENGAELKTVKNKGDGAVVFPKLEYTEADAGKTYHYTISEVDQSAEGYIYDGTVFNLAVAVTDDGNGQMSTAAVWTKNETPVNPDAVAFTNEYHAQGSLALSANKVLNGRKLSENQFSFVLKGKDGIVIETIKNNAKGEVAFTPLKYTEADAGKTYQYTIEEVDGKEAGYTYDKAIYELEVTVTDDGKSHMETTVVQKKNGTDIPGNPPIIFTNTYKANGSFTATATKTLEGRNLEGEQFSFTLTNESGEIIDTAKNDGKGDVQFKTLNYTEADADKKFTYTIAEKATSADGYTCDGSVYKLEVAVTDAGNGQMNTVGTLTKTGSPDAVAIAAFKNYYKAEGSLSLNAEKKLSGRTIEANQFMFVVKEGETKVAEGTNDAAGKIAFSQINYVQDKDTNPLGEHTYTVSELKGSASGYTYDEKEYTVKVMVSDNGDGTLKSEITSMKLADTDVDALKFDNTYKASGTLTIQGTKFLNGRALADKQFDFELKNEAGDVLETVSNGQAGEFKFTELKYTEQDAGKTYKYTVSEKNKAAVGYTYDDSVYTLTVNVKDDGKSHMTAEAVLTKDGASVEGNAITFTNTYKANVSFTPTAKKTLSGRILEDEQFSFTLKDKDGKILETVKNDGHGDVVFPTLKYTEADAGKSYTYMIEETDQDTAGYTYDGTVYQLDISVTDNGDGKMNAADVWTKVGSPDEVTLAVFTNEYKAEGSLSLKAQKILNGTTLKENQFSFILKDKDGVILETVKNNSNGVIEFAPISFTEKDADKTFTYTVQEVIGKETGYTYDQAIYKVTVKVTDGGNGKLEFNTVFETGQREQKSILFTNNYKKPGTNTPVTPTTPKKVPTTVNTNKNADNAKTDDSTPIIPYTAACLAALAVIIAGLKRKRKVSQ